jgi:MYXO-CTERM domain-containing protein
MRFGSLASVALYLALTGETSHAASIHVINAGVQGAVGAADAVSALVSLGHSVSTGGTLADYDAFDQVWDLRYTTNLVAQDVAAFSAYLASGGRVFVVGEQPAFDAQRNASLLTFLAGVGAGSVTYGTGVALNSQTFTAAGAALNAPNVLAGVSLLGARSVASPGGGFLVSEFAPGLGSIVAWDFGDIAGSPQARMVAQWDIDAFRASTGNGSAWVENLVSYLGANPSVPEPALPSLGFAALCALAALRRRRSI